MLIIDNEFQDVDTLKGKMRLQIVRPKDASTPEKPKKYPGIIWYSEIFQVTGPIKRTAQLLAGHGFVVVMPEVYHEFMEAGTCLQYNPQDTQKGNDYKAAKEMASWDSDAQAAVSFLEGYQHCTGSVGVAGVCLGGGLAFRAAVVCPSIRALVCWYPTDLHKGMSGPPVEGDADGEPMSPAGDALVRTAAGELKCESLLFFGRQDPHIPVEGRLSIRSALDTGRCYYQWVEVNGQHAFLRDESSYGRYDPELATISYDWAVKVFNRCLR
jgi:carboxymethylenebutenolidase